MKVIFRKSFQRDLKKLKKSHQILERIREKIEEVENADALEKVKSLKKLSGADYYYRIRVGDYRLGIALRNGKIEFIRCLHRRDIYRYFP